MSNELNFKLKWMMTCKGLHLAVEPSTSEFFLLDDENKSHASGQTIAEVVASWESHNPDRPEVKAWPEIFKAEQSRQ